MSWARGGCASLTRRRRSVSGVGAAGLVWTGGTPGASLQGVGAGTGSRLSGSCGQSTTRSRRVDAEETPEGRWRRAGVTKRWGFATELRGPATLHVSDITDNVDQKLGVSNGEGFACNKEPGFYDHHSHSEATPTSDPVTLCRRNFPRTLQDRAWLPLSGGPLV